MAAIVLHRILSQESVLRRDEFLRRFGTEECDERKKLCHPCIGAESTVAGPNGEYSSLATRMAVQPADIPAIRVSLVYLKDASRPVRDTCTGRR